MSTAAAGTAPARKCSKCQKETDASDDGGGNSDAAAAAVALCNDCKDSLEATTTTTATTTTATPAATVTGMATTTATQQQSKSEELITMEIDTDLTTTETLDDDLEEKDDTTKHEERNKKREEASQGAREAQKARPASPAETELAATAASDVKMAAELTTPTASPAPPRTTPAGKVTRQNLNGARSPTVMKRLRKSTRSTRFKSKLTGRAGGAGASGGGATNNGATNGGHNGQGSVTGTTPKASGKAGGGAGGAGGARNRRTLFKRPAQKTPRVQACTRFVKSLFYKGSYMQIGDIVSIVDSEQNVYYAQIRGLLVDAYCEKSAFLTWLIPTQDSPDPKEGFDPATYLIGKSVRDAPRLRPSLEGIPASYFRILKGLPLIVTLLPSHEEVSPYLVLIPTKTNCFSSPTLCRSR